jgi:redox-sensitive bicupin YhaK (pirin superfamily)
MTEAIEQVIETRPRDIGGFEVRRLLPHAKRRMVGPFIFFDHMGPAQFGPGEGIDLRPHPHIGLATVTYLFEGEIVHRDSLGMEQTIRPGDVNWMTAGRGIVHSERTDPARRDRGQSLNGIQTWVALPKHLEEIEPAFAHHPKASLPVIKRDGVCMRLIVGSAFGETAPAAVYSGIFYLHVQAKAGSRFTLPAALGERAVYSVEGALRIDGAPLAPAQMAVLRDGTDVEISAAEDASMMLAGGATMDGPRHIWWNFVSSSKDRIEQAKADWKGGAFPKVPGDETNLIPLPDK